ncbi:uncharacterized protein TRIADDRAFT_50794 [Trichoplax adhaerens]|uniref:Ribose-phosphate pyrophosphokinase N-terminal domain-containing protein n=1 Tax=Trichoplax adhaerens TaxID=10228 RepID=B3S6Z0_TRIAD|nr:hypothetical protein TRIADDRAFT_50794 [Trichoplax adhaerens]EDV21476.1 hypothetical protein TRIADDRAFT_50794 [Trichoplax adhaerens]|eukprot:XP_002116076.1 hypothetical protein TRIADDRAFT_50794 [Trichoplax adhaerens]
MYLFSGQSHPTLSRSVSELLGEPIAAANVASQSNGESKVNILVSVREKDVFIIQTGADGVNNFIFEFLIMVYACKTSAAKRIVAVMPYLPYSKHSKMRNRSAIPAKLVASMMCKAGVSHVITVDLHHKEVQGFFNCPVDNLRASPFIIRYIQQDIPDYKNAVVVAREPGSTKRATSFAERLHLTLAVIHGESKSDYYDEDGSGSPPPEYDDSSVSRVLPSVLPEIAPKEKPPMTLVGDVTGKIAIIIDDMIDNLDLLLKAAELLEERGAYKIYALATHGQFTQSDAAKLDASCLEEIVVTNTIPQKINSSKLKTIDISQLIAESIRRIHNGESMSYLFRNIPADEN